MAFTHCACCACRGLQNRVDELKQELDSSTPNLKAPEQYEAVKEKEKELVRDTTASYTSALCQMRHHCYHSSDTLLEPTMIDIKLIMLVKPSIPFWIAVWVALFCADCGFGSSQEGAGRPTEAIPQVDTHIYSTRTCDMCSLVEHTQCQELDISCNFLELDQCPQLELSRT
jgi:hypothetical protein